MTSDKATSEPRLKDFVEESALADELGLKNVYPLRTLRYANKLRCSKIGNRVFYYEPDVVAYLLANTQGHVKKIRKTSDPQVDS